MRGYDSESLADGDSISALQGIQRNQLSHAESESIGDLGKIVSAADLVEAVLGWICRGSSIRARRARFVGDLARRWRHVGGQTELLTDPYSVSALEAVERDQFTHADVMSARDRGERVATLYDVIRIASLPRVSMFFGNGVEALA